MLLPVAPPRLVPGLGLGESSGLEAGKGDLLGLPYNEYAAFPSMHVGALIILAARGDRDAQRSAASGVAGAASPDGGDGDRHGQPLRPQTSTAGAAIGASFARIHPSPPIARGPRTTAEPATDSPWD